MQAPPTPGQHHAHLAAHEGTWKVVTKVWLDPSQPPMTSQGTERIRMTCNGLWQVTDFETGEGMARFTGHGVTGFDPATGKYTGVWVDSMMTAAMPYEGECGEGGRRLVCRAHSPGPDGRSVMQTMATVLKDKNTKVFTITRPGAGGKEQVVLEIVATR